MKWCLSHLVRLLLHNHETVANTKDRPPFPTK